MQSEFYKKYMHSEEWRKKAAQRIEIDGHKCVMCDRPESRCRKGLAVHHITYQRLGNENVYTDIVSLCDSCHQKIHRYYNRIREAVT